MTIGDLDPRLLWHPLRGWYLPEDTEPDRAAHLRAAERLRASHDALLAAAKRVVEEYDGKWPESGFQIDMFSLRAAIAKAEAS
jgi:hypothetical protein